MDNALYQNNLEILARRFPSVKETLSSGEIEPGSLQPHWIMGERGKPTVFVMENERQRFLHSKYDPQSEAQRWAAEQSPPADAVILILGWGLGYHVIEWIRQHGKRIRAAIAIEPEPALFQQSLHTTNLGELPHDGSFDIVLGSNGEWIYQALLSKMEALIGGNLVTLPLPFSDIYSRESLSVLQSEIRKIVLTREGMLQHMATLGYRCQECIIRNIPAMVPSLLPRHVRGIAAGQPGIVVAAGPSLDRNLTTLFQAKGRAWIFAVDTSLRVLTQHGLDPEFTITKDPTERNLAHFQGLDTIGHTTLIFDPQSDPDIPSRFKNRRILMPNRNNTLHHYLAGLELEMIDSLPLSTNSALAAFNMAVVMGCDPIIFTGLDLCFAADMGRSHSQHAALTSETRFSVDTHQLTYSRGPACDVIQAVEVEGIDGKRYPTTTTFLEALRLLETLIRQSGVRCIDASEGGAKILGTEIIPLAQTLERYCTKPIDDSLWQQIQLPNRNRMTIKQSVDTIAGHIETCGVIAQDALAIIQSKPDHVIKELDTRRHQIEEGYRLYHVLQSALERLMAEIKRSTFWDASTNTEDVLLQRYQWYFKEIRQACETFGPIYRRVSETI